MKLGVYREFLGEYQRVGMLSNETGEASFRYDPEYSEEGFPRVNDVLGEILPGVERRLAILT